MTVVPTINALPIVEMLSGQGATIGADCLLPLDNLFLTLLSINQPEADNMMNNHESSMPFQNKSVPQPSILTTPLSQLGQETTLKDSLWHQPRLNNPPALCQQVDDSESEPAESKSIPQTVVTQQWWLPAIVCRYNIKPSPQSSDSQDLIKTDLKIKKDYILQNDINKPLILNNTEHSVDNTKEDFYKIIEYDLLQPQAVTLKPEQVCLKYEVAAENLEENTMEFVNAQVAAKIITMKQDGIKKIIVHLEPAHLGKVEIIYDFSKSNAEHIQISVENASTLHAMQQSKPLLISLLASIGVSSAAIDLKLKEDREQHDRMKVLKSTKSSSMPLDLSRNSGNVFTVEVSQYKLNLLA